MSGDDCNCDQCNNCDDPYPNEHDEECVCDECHEEFHDDPYMWEDICDACKDYVAHQEDENGNGEQQENPSNN